jgi:U3 small nucleolar RNA-associated protein 14
MAARIRQAALKIAGHEALDLGDDESEIDSDAAWDEEGSDDERWGGAFEKWKKNGQSKKAVKAKQQKAKEVRSFLEPDLRTSLTVPLVQTVETPLNIDLDESDDDMAKTAGAFRPNVAAFVGDNDEDEDDDEDDLELELEDDENMEDEDDEDDEDEQPPASRFKKAVAKGDDNQEEQEDEETASEEDEDEDEEDEDMPEPSLPSESDSEADNDDADLLDFVQSLPSVGKRKVDDEEAKEEAQSKRRRVLSSQRGPGGRDDAGEFGTTSGKF